jgi:hypothetical protein
MGYADQEVVTIIVEDGVRYGEEDIGATLADGPLGSMLGDLLVQTR